MNGAASSSPTLTARQREVVTLMRDGLSNRIIARRLGISEHTAKFHVNGLMDKLDARNRVNTVVKALRLSLIPLEGP